MNPRTRRLRKHARRQRGLSQTELSLMLLGLGKAEAQLVFEYIVNDRMTMKEARGYLWRNDHLVWMFGGPLNRKIESIRDRYDAQLKLRLKLKKTKEALCSPSPS